MKKSTPINLVALLLLVIAVLWLNLPKNDIEEPSQKREFEKYILAVSWQPAFCEKLPNLPECRAQRAGRFDTTNFTLHGLWPQPRDNVYCGIPANLVSLDKARRWHELPKLELSDKLRRELAEKMPGYRSDLHRHEWYKHGSCMTGYTAEDYFRISLDLLDQLNASGFHDLVQQNIGRELTFRDLQNAFVRSFGRNSSQRLVVDCYRDDGRRIIQELKLSIAGELSDKSLLPDVLSDGKNLGGSCPRGIVDRVGLQ